MNRLKVCAMGLLLLGLMLIMPLTARADDSMTPPAKTGTMHHGSGHMMGKTMMHGKAMTKMHKHRKHHRRHKGVMKSGMHSMKHMQHPMKSSEPTENEKQ